MSTIRIAPLAAPFQALMTFVRRSLRRALGRAPSPTLELLHKALQGR